MHQAPNYSIHLVFAYTMRAVVKCTTVQAVNASTKQARKLMTNYGRICFMIMASRFLTGSGINALIKTVKLKNILLFWM